MIAIENAATLNAAFCDLHLKRCPPSEQLTTVCSTAKALYEDVKRESRALELQWKCSDHFAQCKGWASGAVLSLQRSSWLCNHRGGLVLPRTAQMLGWASGAATRLSSL